MLRSSTDLIFGCRLREEFWDLEQWGLLRFWNDGRRGSPRIAREDKAPLGKAYSLFSVACWRYLGLLWRSLASFSYAHSNSAS